jgi:ribonuclease HI
MIIAAADGSALGNPGPAGWAWYVDDDCWASGGWPHGTNNMGELMAVLDLLQQTAHLDEPLQVYCDSTYVINAITKWMKGWKRKGWKKGDGKPVMNVELMKALDAAMEGRWDTVEYVWVKGHAGHVLNEAADLRANAAATAFRDGRQPEPGPGFAHSVVAHPAATVGQVEPEPDLFSGLEPGDAPATPGPVPGSVDVELVSLDLVDDDTVRLGWRSAADDPSTVRSSTWVRHDGRWERATLSS